ncbi:class F sortase [Streptomyces sp. NPDC001046]|uniref:class F sortase n=1 Tax=Streptomyces sp. NPDC001046 TaxID=3364543 RepID=UPI0036982D12
MSLLVMAVSWDRDGRGGDAVTALPPGSARAAAGVPPGSEPGAATPASGSAAGADAPPHGSGTGTVAVPGPADRTAPARPSAASPTPAPGARTAAPARTRPAAAPSRAPGTRTAASPGREPAAPGSRADDPAARPPRSSAARSGRARPAAPAARTPRPRPALRPLPHSRAARLVVPYLRIDAPVMSLGLDRDHRLTAPPDDDPDLVGWYDQGAAPGGQGTAVAVGHLDTDSGPAVFAGLPQLKKGRTVEVRRADGRTAVYTVDKVRSYEKAHFPSQEVYGTRGRPELRLITCGGTYDRRKGYSGNVVVFAHLTAVR